MQLLQANRNTSQALEAKVMVSETFPGRPASFSAALLYAQGLEKQQQQLLLK